jgi:hypothetical protein
LLPCTRAICIRAKKPFLFCVGRVTLLCCSTFTILPAADIPAEFGADIVSHVPSSSQVLDSKRHVSVFDTVLNSLFIAVLNDSFSQCHKTILDSAMCSLLGTQDHNLLKAAFHGATRIQAIFKAACASKVTLAIEKATVQCLECLLKCDPELSSVTVSGLVSFISKSKVSLASEMFVVRSLHHHFCS